MNDEQLVIHQTECWIKSVIIELNFCPFAKRELERGSIRYRVSRDKELTSGLQTLIDECVLLDSDDNIETSLLIFPDAFSEFVDYLQLVEMAESLMVQQGYEGIYQLASFHPAYVFAESIFADSDSDDAANYTNRSPYPMLHLIREASVERVLQHYPNPERIPERNIEVARTAGLEIMKARLKACAGIKQK